MHPHKTEKPGAKHNGVKGNDPPRPTNMANELATEIARRLGERDARRR